MCMSACGSSFDIGRGQAANAGLYFQIDSDGTFIGRTPATPVNRRT